MKTLLAKGRMKLSNFFLKILRLDALQVFVPSSFHEITVGDKKLMLKKLIADIKGESSITIFCLVCIISDSKDLAVF